ncbi:hypothetical protein ABMA27_014953 [Loxostege sticticalis]|uniref:DUF7041 domain-containing protein n=1 Tax=Loxostege sticticalis TaxID=481309 RepID=A0ABR3IAS4_LOXSC
MNSPQHLTTPPPATASTSTASAELASVTVSSRLPEFWCDQPRLWFVQCEAILTPQKLSDEAKYNLVVTKLGKEVIKQVSDILLTPPSVNKFGTLKSRLLTVYEESENRQLQKLLSEIELGDQKPSQLLRYMRDLARGKIPDDTLSIMWQGHLPSSIRAVLAVSEIKDLENLAAIADKVLENTRPLQVSEVTSEATSPFTQLQAQIAQLSLQVVELQRSRSRNRNNISRNYNNRRQHFSSRSTSRGRNLSRRTDVPTNGLCFYHNRFRHRANKCSEPCTWKTNKTSSAGN